MAVDLIVTPLSKYWSGDYITPVMRDAWEMGATYSIVTPGGTKTIPKGTPYGGEDAKSERAKLVAFVEQIMDALPFEGASGAWDEKSDHFGFHRVDPDAFGELAKRSEAQFTRKAGFFGCLKGTKDAVSHIGRALIFMPLDFDAPFDLQGKIFASLHAAKRELDSGDWSGIPPEALQPITEAFEEAKVKNLPLVIDL